MAFTCGVLDSDGNSFVTSNIVLDSDGNPFIVSGTVLDSDGNAFVVCVATDVDTNAGGEDPEAKRRRYQLIAAQKEDKLIISIVKTYMKHII